MLVLNVVSVADFVGIWDIGEFTWTMRDQDASFIFVGEHAELSDIIDEIDERFKWVYSVIQELYLKDGDYSSGDKEERRSQQSNIQRCVGWDEDLKVRADHFEILLQIIG